jgi:signal transduction histidine kinase
MRLSLKTEFTLATSLLVLAVVAVVSALYLARLTRQTLRQSSDNADFIAHQVYEACGNALKEAAQQGEAPASTDPADVRQYVRHVFDNSSTVNSLIESDMGISPTIYEITISDADGVVLMSSDASLRERKVARRLAVNSLARAGFFQQLRELYGPPQIYEFSLPFQLQEEPFGAIRVGLSSAFIRNQISPGLQSAGYWALGSVLLSTLLAFVVSSASLAPIGRISAQLDRISAGQFDAEPAVARGDELGAVSTKIVGIGKRMHDVQEILRLGLLGHQMAGVAHEVKNPLNSMRLWLEVLKGNMPEALEPQQAVKMLDSEIERLDRAVKTFLNFTRPVELKLEETRLQELLGEVLEAARPAVTKAGLALRADLSSDCPPVRADRQLIHQAVMNLVLNASEFTDPGGSIMLRLRRSGDHAVVAVEDSGRGIPPENQKKIFDLFFTTRPGGTGIGLANTFRFVQLHNGRIEFESQPGHGTTFRVELPLARPSKAPGTKVRDLGQLSAAEKG